MGHLVLERVAVVVCVPVSVARHHVSRLLAAEAGRGRRRGGLAEGERGAGAAQGEGGASVESAAVLGGGRQDDWLAALLLEERRGGGLQNEFGALNALVLITLREAEGGKETPEAQRQTEGDHRTRDERTGDWMRERRGEKLLVPVLEGPSR